ncbi:ricin-type beta-trefoil lectin domain protein [Streptomyces sp. NPDC046261]|uniref:RICIN domain-containing protein n=1 Tax=Streptomyces sp. NPDC046261 TaxID=3157200 RepID=UPI0033E3170D
MGFPDGFVSRMMRRRPPEEETHVGVRIKGGGVGLAAGLVCVLAGVQPASAAEAEADADTYSFVNEATGRCLDARSLTGTLPCDGGDAQKWVVSTGSGPSPVSMLRNAAVGGCLSVRGWRGLSMAPCDGVVFQQWKLSSTGSTSLKNMGVGLCVDDVTGTLTMDACGAGKAGQRWAKRS